MGLIGSALGAAGSIFGGIAASKAMKNIKQNIEEQRQKNQNWYDRRYNEDATQRADAQAVLTRVEDNIRNRNRQAAGTQAVMGGTEESVAAAKEANNQALASATSQIAANAEQRKDNIEATYLQNDAAYANQLNQLEQGKAQAIAGAVQGLSSLGDIDIAKIKINNDEKEPGYITL